MRARGAAVSLQMGKGSYWRALVLGLVMCSPDSLGAWLGMYVFMEGWNWGCDVG